MEEDKKSNPKRNAAAYLMACASAVSFWALVLEPSWAGVFMTVGSGILSVCMYMIQVSNERQEK